MIKSVPDWVRWFRGHRYQIVAPLVALLFVAAFERTELAERLEDATVDMRYRARAPYDPPADPRLIFVGIDQQSLDHFGAWPWPRIVIADCMRTIITAGANPRVVAFDILFSEEYDKLNLQSKSGLNFDDDLADVAGKLPSGSVITGALSNQPQHKGGGADEEDAKKTKAELARESMTLPCTNIEGDIQKIEGSDIATFPVSSLRKVTIFGFVNVAKTSIDGIHRTIPFVIRVQDKIYPSLSLQILCQMLAVDPDKVQVHVGHDVTLTNISGKTWVIPINEKGQYTINYRREESFQTLSFYWLFRNLEESKRGIPLPPDCKIDQKVLLIGQSAEGLTDLGPSPYEPRSPLPFTHLQVVNNVLHHDFLTVVPWLWVTLGWLLISWGTLFRLFPASLTEAIVLPVAVVVLYILLAFAIFSFWSIQIALVWPVFSYTAVNFGAIVLRWREEQRGRKELRQIFSRMLSPDLLNHLLEHPANLKLGGSKRTVTILFSDIRDYTRFSEGLDEQELVRQLNEYFERMVNCVLECQGRIDKFIGDAIMAVWGDLAVLSRGLEQDATSAVRAALRMRQEMQILNEERAAAGLVPLRIGIGLNHGQVVVGQIGSSSKSEFTAIGDSVNVASRLEGLTKEFHADIAISDSVRSLLGDLFLLRRLGVVLLKGKNIPTLVYEVLAEKTKGSALTKKEEQVAHYEAAFDHFLARRFTQAEAGFLACEALSPDDYCVQRYLKASREFIIAPPPADWKGTIVMESK